MQARLVMKKVREPSEILNILNEFDTVFSPPLSRDRQDFAQYAKKLAHQATTYTAENNRKRVGFITFYCADVNAEAAFISLLAVLPDYKGKGIAQDLLNKCVEEAKETGKKAITLEVETANEQAIRFYQKNGFQLTEKTNRESYYMNRKLEG